MSAAAPAVRKEVISTPNAPAALAAYSQAIRAGNTLYCSGCLGMDKDSGALVEGGVEVECERALVNLRAVLEAGGSSMDNVLKTTVFLTTMDNYAAVNAVYLKHFTRNPPARSCFAVAALPKGGLVEIEAVALVGEASA